MNNIEIWDLSVPIIFFSRRLWYFSVSFHNISEKRKLNKNKDLEVRHFKIWYFDINKKWIIKKLIKIQGSVHPLLLYFVRKEKNIVHRGFFGFISQKFRFELICCYYQIIASEFVFSEYGVKLFFLSSWGDKI